VTEPDGGREPRILIWDIETAPILGTAWDKWQTNLLWIERDRYLLTIAWKWLGEKQVHCLGLPDFPDRYKKDPQDDYALARLAWELFNEADVVVAHNGIAFDTRKAQTRMVTHGFPPPSPFLEVDTLRIARRHFSFTSNRLGDVCEQLGIGSKLDAGGEGLWRRCVAGDPKAWKHMKKYNRHDVVILEALYLKLRSWADRLPNLATLSDRPSVCPRCGRAARMQVRGYRHTAVTTRISYQCQQCKGYCSGRPIKRSRAQYVVP
jgi:hypothetical protein